MEWNYGVRVGRREEAALVCYGTCLFGLCTCIGLIAFLIKCDLIKCLGLGKIH